MMVLLVTGLATVVVTFSGMVVLDVVATNLLAVGWVS